MLKKTHRLKEREVKKVLSYRKPFFAYSLVANTKASTLSYPRFALVLSGKNTRTSVSRNFFRRKFYDMAKPYIAKNVPIDIVVVAKKGNVYAKNDAKSIETFEKDIAFLFKNLFK